MKITRVGIIGKGKMGRDIFNYLLSFDYQLSLVCRRAEDVPILIDEVEKQLLKMQRRGFLSAEGYEMKKKAIVISDDLAILKECDCVIESVIEDTAIKQNLLREIARIVSKDCILASNTSSIPLQRIFESCEAKERCLGIHFFYPVKLIRTVEVNLTRLTSSLVCEKVRNFVTAIDKVPFELPEAANSVLNRIYLALFAQIYLFYQDRHLKIEELNAFYKENLLPFGLFEIIDSAGLDIIVELFVNSMAPRYEALYHPLFHQAQDLLQQGYKGGFQGKGIMAHEAEFPPVLQHLEGEALAKYLQNILVQMQGLLLNEIAYLSQKNGIDQTALLDCVHEVLGLYEHPLTMLERIGQHQLAAALEQVSRQTHNRVYEPVERFYPNANPEICDNRPTEEG